MKRRITVEQLNELTQEQKEKLREWWKPEPFDLFTRNYTIRVVDDCTSEIVQELGNGYESYNKNSCLPLLSIGQCIELLTGTVKYMGVFDYSFIDFSWDIEEGELIDVLFQAVKSIL